MTSYSLKKFALFVLAATATVSLSACHVDLGVGIHPDGNVNSVIELHDDDGKLAALGAGDSCDDLLTAIKSQVPGGSGEVKVTDISTDGHLGCRFTAESEKSAIDGKNLKETDDTFIFSTEDTSQQVPPAQLSMLESMGTFTLTIAMPGDIIKAEGAEINGNIATYKSLSTIVKGITVEGHKEGTGSLDDAKIGQNSATPLWIWIVAGVGIVVVIGVLIFLLIRKKPTTELTPAPYHNPDAPMMPTSATPAEPTQPGDLAQPTVDDINAEALSEPEMQAGNHDDEPQLR